MIFEEKFLLKEKEKIYANKNYFPQMDLIKKEIKTKGTKITNIYLPVDIIENLKKENLFSLKFVPKEIILEKINNEHFIIFKLEKSSKNTKYKKPIKKETYKEYKKLKKEIIEKYHLKKRIKNISLNIYYIPKDATIFANVIVKNKVDLNKIPKIGKKIFEKSFSNNKSQG